MSRPAAGLDIAPPGTALSRWFPDPTTLAIWLGASLIAVFFALVGHEATFVNGTFVPRGNDSFYHARRILDAAVGTRGFYQFDPRLNAPDGSWISWPWAYDYLMAKATQVALWFAPTLDPMAVMSVVPVLWIFVNAGIFMAATGELNLSREMRLLALLCFAMSPLTQMLHSIAMIDHHYVEYTFVLLNVWLGLRWLNRPNDGRRAAALGVALGIAPAFHNGLFILQIVPLACVFVLWLRRAAPARTALWAFGIALVIATQVVLLPSEPYRRGMFAFGLLSWFHFYVAVCTAAAMEFMAWRGLTRTNLGLFLALCAGLAVPLVPQVISGIGFLSGNFSILDQIAEVRSPYRLFTDTLGPMGTVGYYTWLLPLAPVLLVYYGYRVLRERRPARLYYAVAVVFGLVLFLDQWRLHYYGFFGFITGGLLLLEDWRLRRHWHRGAVFVATFAAIALAYRPALHERLFALDVPGSDFGYANAIGAYQALHDLCARNPGVVLASSSDGAPILFHTECSVIATNFILTQDDAAHIDEVARLLSSTPERIREERPDVKYVFLRSLDFGVLDDDGVRFVEGNAVVDQLLRSDSPPPGYTLIRTLVFRAGKSGASNVYARLYAVSHDSGASTGE